MRRKDLIDKIVRCAEDKGWKVDTDTKQSKGLTLFEFSQYTPAGQDFSFTATMKANRLDSLIADMEEYHEWIAKPICGLTATDTARMAHLIA